MNQFRYLRNKNLTFYILIFFWISNLSTYAQAPRSEEFLNPLTFKTVLVLMDQSNVRGILYRVTPDSVWVNIAQSNQPEELVSLNYESVKMIKLQKNDNWKKSIMSGMIVGSVFGSSMGLMVAVEGELATAIPIFIVPTAIGALAGAVGSTLDWHKFQIDGKIENLTRNFKNLQEFSKYASFKPRFYGIL